MVQFTKWCFLLFTKLWRISWVLKLEETIYAIVVAEQCLKIVMQKKGIGKSLPLVLICVVLVSIVGFLFVPNKKDVNLSAKPYIVNKWAENYFNGKTSCWQSLVWV